MSVGQEHDSGADDPDLIISTSVRYSPPARQWLWSSIQPCRTCREAPTVLAKVEGRLTSPNARVPEIITQRCGGITVKVIRSNRSPIPPMRSLSATPT